MSIFDGMQPRFMHVPPKLLRSTIAMRQWSISGPMRELPEPAPMMTRSYCFVLTAPGCHVASTITRGYGGYPEPKETAHGRLHLARTPLLPRCARAALQRRDRGLAPRQAPRRIREGRQ